ncbi:maleylpyruvate isomerase family mycothiol-dependent enzyme [Cellulomonas sp. DKR-3]|uniref:Maleylpyruvate isomerase family mycothiol-dependent enzyme n=1 Tax=Cellulomonas fulva TaxID=2835530 RepID=A0ABS5TWY9_9CELL|nr:maleylpyruvate isomerase family mycothiol-dependent enzyme [Cellulomonas fulva]MBT0993643.1 maleylpyruvate isomerase family mycothiol-dependent enzyme [Cellulomonas fulva]
MSEQTTIERYDEGAAGMQAAIDAVSPAGWDAASPCAGWTGRDVVAHLVDSQRDLLARHGAELGARPDLADPSAAWRVHTAQVHEALARPGFVEQEYESLGSTTTVGATLDTFIGFDMVAHRWDVTAADGRAYPFEDADLDVIEGLVAAMGEMIRSDGVCGPALEVGPDADRQTRALAALGRSADVG